MTINTGFRTSCPVCHEIEAYNVGKQECERCARITRPIPPASARFNINIYVKISVAIGISLLFVGSFFLQWKFLTTPVEKEKVKPQTSPLLPKPQSLTQVNVSIVSKLQEQQEQEESFITIGNITKRLVLDRTNGRTKDKVEFTLPISTDVIYSIKTTTILKQAPELELVGKGEGTWASSTDEDLLLWGDWDEKTKQFNMQLQVQLDNQQTK